MWPAVWSRIWPARLGVPAEAHFDGEWSEHTQRHQRAQIRKHFGFRPFRARDESVLVGWLSHRVGSFNPEAEALKRMFEKSWQIKAHGADHGSPQLFGSWNGERSR